MNESHRRRGLGTVKNLALKYAEADGQKKLFGDVFAGAS
jgi:hypothetical protein